MKSNLLVIALILYCLTYLEVLAMDHTDGKAKANYLIGRVVVHNHDPIRTLGRDNDVSFGGYGFHYDHGRDELTVRVLIGKLDYGVYGPDNDAALRKTARLVTDPKYGGLFETGGARLLDDEVRNGSYLVKTYPLKTTEADFFAKDLGHLSSLSGRYLMSWAGHILHIADGKEPPPTHFVTLENDPYPHH